MAAKKTIGILTGGSHAGALLPVRRNTGVSFFDGPPIVSGAAFCVKQARLTDCHAQTQSELTYGS
jgi:fructose 1,6-bisphosphate aldolase/phosphatase